MKKKSWILLVVFLFVLLVGGLVFASVKTNFFGLLETKDETKQEDKDSKKDEPKKENNAYRVDCSMKDTEEDFGMKIKAGAHFLKTDKSLIDMDMEVIVDFSSEASEMTEDELNEGLDSFEKELTEDIGLTCEKDVEDTLATFKCKGTKKDILSATDENTEVMNYDSYLKNMESMYTCKTKEVYTDVE